MRTGRSNFLKYDLIDNNELLLAIERLQYHPRVVSEHVQKAKSLENNVEEDYREALAELLSGSEDTKHILKILKQREIYRYLSNVADRGDEAAALMDELVTPIAANRSKLQQRG
jgi:uncharacterized protein Yka (UPF0111/DUF47 family)